LHFYNSPVKRILGLITASLFILILTGCSQPKLDEATSRSTQIEFALPQSGDALIQISNRFDTVVKTYDLPELNAGHHQIHWDGTDNDGDFLPLGIYWAALFLDGAQIGRTIQLQLLQAEA